MHPDASVLLLGDPATNAECAHAVAEPVTQLIQQPLAAIERAGEAVADPHGQIRRRRLVIHHDIEVRVK